VKDSGVSQRTGNNIRRGEYHPLFRTTELLLVVSREPVVVENFYSRVFLSCRVFTQVSDEVMQILHDALLVLQRIGPRLESLRGQAVRLLHLDLKGC
jgi:hypothetical protein